MGQYYRAVILASEKDNGRELIRTWIEPLSYANGSKLMEHSYVGNSVVEAVEYLISPIGMFYKSRIVWAGDYADKEENSSDNLHDITFQALNEEKGSCLDRKNMVVFQYIVNHTLKKYTKKNGNGNIHPLPLLTVEGNGRGGGDYRGGNDDLVGSWARDVISVEMEIPDGYDELVCEFSRY